MIPKVQEWLEKQGFSLEMRTASAFRAAGFEVRQSSYYIDSEMGKAREIDVLAIHPDFIGIVNIRFVIECKSSKHPWVLLSSPDTLTGYSRLFAFAAMSQKARGALAEGVLLEKMLTKVPWFRKDGLTGYSLRQAFSDNDVAYAAAIGVAKACECFVRERQGKYESLNFGFPVIVVDAPLIRCLLSENGEIQLEEIDEGEFLFTGHELGACIRVVTASRLTAFAVEARKAADQLRAELKNEEEQIRESWRDR
jgi:hypothetical protein